MGLETLKVVVRQPMVATETVDKFDVLVNVRGGGFTGQAGAIRHGISRALLQADAEYRPILKKAGFLTIPRSCMFWGFCFGGYGEGESEWEFQI